MQFLFYTERLTKSKVKLDVKSKLVRVTSYYGNIEKSSMQKRFFLSLFLSFQKLMYFLSASYSAEYVYIASIHQYI